MSNIEEIRAAYKAGYAEYSSDFAASDYSDSALVAEDLYNAYWNGWYDAKEGQ